MCGGMIVQKTGESGVAEAVAFLAESLRSMDKRWHCVVPVSLPAVEIPEYVWFIAFRP